MDRKAKQIKMKKCPYCAEEIQDEAIICRFCNKELIPKVITGKSNPPKKTSSSKILTAIILFFIVIGAILIYLYSSGKFDKKDGNVTKDTYTTAPAYELQKIINEYKTLGLLKKIELGNYFYVDPEIWNNIDVDKKKGICMFFADYAKSQGNKCYCELYDYMTGKKIAYLGPWGFEIY